jgi:hypothetical protein
MTQVSGNRFMPKEPERAIAAPGIEGEVVRVASAPAAGE